MTLPGMQLELLLYIAVIAFAVWLAHIEIHPGYVMAFFFAYHALGTFLA